jgi:hypothetical protein
VYGPKLGRSVAVSRALLPSPASQRTGLESELIQRVSADFVGLFTSLGWAVVVERVHDYRCGWIVGSSSEATQREFC